VPNTSPSLRRSLSIVALVAGISMLGCTTRASAEAPMQKTQAPGFYRTMLGDFEITALMDGVIDLDAALLKNLPATEVEPLLKRAMIDNPHKVPTATNAYLINTGDKLVLVDAGGGNTFGKALGYLQQNLAAAGYKPDQIDAVPITHLHGDHCGGLIDADGKPAFPNATLYVAKPEADYWLSTAEPTVPDVFKEHFRKARNLVKQVLQPYIDRNRFKTFEFGPLPIPGITAAAIVGHTPGHTAYTIESQRQKLVIIGDVVHFAAVQFARPDAAVMFDVDPKLAVATRQTLFQLAADDKPLVAAMHVAFPGIGRLRSDANNAYTWLPVEYTPLPATKPDNR
jgi:glyoxylase-like metal-dependent hydrolase (beta-lactamase superfamily II)